MDKGAFVKFIKLILITVYIKNKKFIYTYWNSGLLKFQMMNKAFTTACQSLDQGVKGNRIMIIYYTENRLLSLCEIKTGNRNYIDSKRKLRSLQ